MSSAIHAEKVLFQHLTVVDSLGIIVAEGLPPEQIPTPELREVYLWSIDYYDRASGERAPSVELMRERWGDLLDDHEIEIEYDPEDAIEWSISTLRGNYAHAESQRFVRAFSTGMGEAAPEAYVKTVWEHAEALTTLALQLERKASHVDLREGIRDRLRAYEARVGAGFGGMSMGMEAVDEQTHGIHPGELAVMAAGPKTGKSYFLAMAAYREWERGRIPILFTLENDVPMTLDRIACLTVQVDPERWQRGECGPEEVEAIRSQIDHIEQADRPFWIIQPDADRRSMQHFAREALLRGADSLFIDQLTFVDAPNPRDPRHLQIRAMMHDLKEMISTGVRRLPCLLAHQINREGVEAARKIGRLYMEHMAEGSEVERTADFVFGLFQTHENRNTARAQLQMLAARRTMLQNWMLDWNISTGLFRVRHEIEYAQ